MSKNTGGGAGGVAGRGGRGGAPAVAPAPAPAPAVQTPPPAPPQNQAQTIPPALAASQMNSTHPNAPVATKVVNYVLNNEAPVTQDVVNIANANGGRMEGLQYRVKNVQRTAEKLEDLSGILPASTSGSQASGVINDSLRYTMTFADANFSQGVQNALADLRRQGFSVGMVKNYFRQGNLYKGVNIDLTRNNMKIEMQFHTPTSYRVKSQTLDPLYTKFRRETDRNVRSQQTQQMLNASNGVPIPPNVSAISSPMQNYRS